MNRGQRLAKIEDFEIVEQVKQAEAAQEVSLATIRQREADLQLAETNVERSRSLFERQLLPKQTLDDNEARYQAALAQLDLARAQTNQSKARLDELRINLANTVITSPVNGFVAKRNVDPGAFVSQNAPVADVVDITRVRLVANVVEKDLKELETGNATRVQVDAYPGGETFSGRIARVSPCSIRRHERRPSRLKFPTRTTDSSPECMLAWVSRRRRRRNRCSSVKCSGRFGGRRGVFQLQNDTAIFRTVQVGSEQGALVEILGGLTAGDEVISTGAGALRDGDRVALAGRASDGRGRQGGGQTTAPGQGGPGQAPSGGGEGDPPAAGGARNPQGPGAGAGDGARSGRGDGTGREGSGGRRGDSGGTGSGEGRRSGGDGSGGRGGNGTSQPPSGGVSQ